MLGCLVGIRQVNFKDTSGKDVSGTRVYFTYDDTNVMGHATDTAFIKSDSGINVSTLKIGDEIQIVYNKYGKVADIVPAK